MNRTTLHMNRTRFISRSIICLSFFISPISYSQKTRTFIYDCVVTGQNMVIDAVITNADANTYYHWQYKTPTTAWTCFVNGLNNINGTNFTVSGATGSGANNAPALTINSVTVALEDVMVRVIMSPGIDPCSIPAPQVWGGDDQEMNETKYLRLHIFSNSLSCPPNAYSCPGNILVNNGKYYGGFENVSFDLASETFSRNNFGSNNAASDFSFGNGDGHYMDINNPYAMNSSFARNIAPHSGDNQLVIQGADNSSRVWNKTINVIAGRQYAFSAWVARIDHTEPVIELKANNSLLASTDMSFVTIGDWNLIQGTFNANATAPVNFNIRNSRTGAPVNFSIDDLCLRECNNCSILELHQLYLSATLSKDEVKLKWVAENEMGTNNFIIEKSYDGINYSRIATKTATGPLNTPTSYYYNDNVQNAGVNTTIYYRIKAMDTNGRYAYSNVVIIRLGKTATVQAWPVPFSDYVNISYTAISNSFIRVTLINAVGKLVRQTTFNVNRGLNQLALNDLQSVSPGLYFLRITDLSTNQVYTRNISK